MDDNTTDINIARRVKNMEKAVAIFENQLAAIKQSIALLSKHKDFRFFSIMCWELTAENKNIAGELLKMRVRLQKAKDELKGNVE